MCSRCERSSIAGCSAHPGPRCRASPQQRSRQRFERSCGSACSSRPVPSSATASLSQSPHSRASATARGRSPPALPHSPWRPARHRHPVAPKLCKDLDRCSQRRQAEWQRERCVDDERPLDHVVTPRASRRSVRETTGAMRTMDASAANIRGDYRARRRGAKASEAPAASAIAGREGGCMEVANLARPSSGHDWAKMAQSW